MSTSGKLAAVMLLMLSLLFLTTESFAITKQKKLDGGVPSRAEVKAAERRLSVSVLVR